MFIEKLSDYEIEMFLKDAQSIYAKKISRCKSEIMVLAPDYETGFGNTNTCVHLSDFHADIETTEATCYALNMQWQHYMTDKFGDKYVNAYNKHKESQMKDELIK